MKKIINAKMILIMETLYILIFILKFCDIVTELNKNNDTMYI